MKQRADTSTEAILSTMMLIRQTKEKLSGDMDDLLKAISDLQDEMEWEISHCGISRKEQEKEEKLKRLFRNFRLQSVETLKEARALLKEAEKADTEGRKRLIRMKEIIAAYNSGRTGGNATAAGGYPERKQRALEFHHDLKKASGWGKRSFEAWMARLTVMERKAVADYKLELFPHSSSYYVNINETLRKYGGESRYFHPGNEFRCLLLHQALLKAEVPEDIVVYRAMTKEAFENMKRSGFKDPGFMSCSLYSRNYFNVAAEVVMRIRVPQGTHGAYIGGIGIPLETECELLLDRGSFFTVTEIREGERWEITGDPFDHGKLLIVEAFLNGQTG